MLQTALIRERFLADARRHLMAGETTAETPRHLDESQGCASRMDVAASHVQHAE